MEQAEDQQTLAPAGEREVSPASAYPKYPNWPTSKRGPRVTEPSPGQRRVLARTDQVSEIGYNQVSGEPGDSAPERSEPDLSMAGKVATDQEQNLRQRLQKKARPDL